MKKVASSPEFMEAALGRKAYSDQHFSMVCTQVEVHRIMQGWGVCGLSLLPEGLVPKADKGELKVFGSLHVKKDMKDFLSEEGISQMGFHVGVGVRLSESRVALDWH